MRTLMIVYGLGYVALYGTFWLLYVHAWRRRESLELNALERFDTRSTILEAAAQVGVATLSVLIATIGGARLSGVAGLTYMLLAPGMTSLGIVRGRQRRRVEQA